MGFRGMRDKAFFGCGIRDWLQNCRGIRDSKICGIRDWPQNDRGIRDSNTSRELDKVRNLFSIPEMAIFHLIAKEIEVAELNSQNIERWLCLTLKYNETAPLNKLRLSLVRR